MSSPVVIPHYLEKDYLQNLNDRFKDYVSRVRQMREQGQRMETANFMNTTKILEDEIMDLKNMYERQLEDLRNKLDEVSRDRTQHQLSAAKNGALAAELQDKYEKCLFIVVKILCTIIYDLYYKYLSFEFSHICLLQS